VRKCVRKESVNCACVVGACGHIFDLRCAILVDRGADEYVNRIYVRIYGLHIRLPPYQTGSKVPLHK
jgi:hypothetical protein